jgi:hypothetical protein
MYACPTFGVSQACVLPGSNFHHRTPFAEPSLLLALRPLSTSTCMRWRLLIVGIREAVTASLWAKPCKTKRSTNEMREAERGSESTN